MFKNTIVEMDRAAKALDMHDVDTAALCLRKALESREEMERPDPKPDPSQTGVRAELSKAVTALELKDFNLASVCFEKAVDQVQDKISEPTLESARRFSTAMHQENYSTMADSLRGVIRSLVGDVIIEPVHIPS